MHGLTIGLALLPALAIIGVGAQYVTQPVVATRSFGLPLPESGTNTAWWLRLKGVRDIASGLVIFALMIWGELHAVGIALLVDVIIPVGDMLLILAAKGSVARAFGIHGITAVLMVIAASLLIAGA